MKSNSRGSYGRFRSCSIGPVGSDRPYYFNFGPLHGLWAVLLGHVHSDMGSSGDARYLCHFQLSGH